jgi:hypothetical protein
LQIFGGKGFEKFFAVFLNFYYSEHTPNRSHSF